MRFSSGKEKVMVGRVQGLINQYYLKQQISIASFLLNQLDEGHGDEGKIDFVYDCLTMGGAKQKLSLNLRPEWKARATNLRLGSSCCHQAKVTGRWNRQIADFGLRMSSCTMHRARRWYAIGCVSMLPARKASERSSGRVSQLIIDALPMSRQ